MSQFHDEFSNDLYNNEKSIIVTYKTIQEAYKNKSGMYCFEKNNEYVFLSRANSTFYFMKLINNGFNYIDFEQVEKLLFNK